MHESSHYHLNVRVPENSDSPLPVEVLDPSSSTIAGFVERANVHSLPKRWDDACGFYILFSGVNPDGTYSVYVGRTNSSFYNRMRSHDQNKDWWSSALLIYKDSSYPFTSTQSAYLEGAVREFFEKLPNVTVTNIAPTGDHTLHADERLAMQNVVNSMARVIRVRGYGGSFHKDTVFTQNPLANHEVSNQTASSQSNQSSNTSDVESTELYKKLAAWRLAKSREIQQKAYVIFKNTTLAEIVTKRPKTPEALKAISGFGHGEKFELYGHEILFIIFNDFTGD